MAFAEVRKQVEFDRYIGVAKVNVLAVMPTKDQLTALGYNPEEEPVYLTTKQDKDGNEYRSLRVEIIFGAKDNEGNDVKFRQSIFLANRKFASNTTGKVQVIDQYGRTAWVTEEQYEKKEIPTYTSKKDGSTVKASIDSNYRYAMQGEGELTDIIRILRNIPQPEAKNKETGKYEPIKDLSKALCRIEKPGEIFNGDMSEIKGAFSGIEDSQIKFFAAIQTNPDSGFITNTLYTRKPMRAKQDPSYTYKEIEKDMAMGLLDNYEFKMIEGIERYTVASTAVSSQPAENPYQEEQQKINQMAQDANLPF